MDFIVETELPSGDITVTIQDGNDKPFRVKQPKEDSNVEAWCGRLERMESGKLEAFFNLIPKVRDIRFSDADHDIYVMLLQATYDLLEKFILQVSAAPSGNLEHLKYLRTELEEFLFGFHVGGQLPNSNSYVVILSRAGKTTLELPISRSLYRNSPVQICQAVIENAYQQKPSEVFFFINHYKNFQKSISKTTDDTIDVFINLSKALINCIRQQGTDFHRYISLVPDICAFILKHERELEEQKIYLDLIFNNRENESGKAERLKAIVNGIEESSSAGKQRGIHHQDDKSDRARRLMQVIGLISDHYLRRYDLIRSAEFWKEAKSRDPALLFFLVLHQYPYFILILQAIPLVILSLFCQPFHSFTSAISLDFSDWRFLLMLICYLPLLFLLITISVQIVRRKWLYSQLLLPRLLGAATVGLFPLLLSDQAWLFGIQIHHLNLIVLLAFTYVGSFFYMYIEVYNTMKFVPSRSITDVLKVSAQIFLIAFSETLFIVTTVSTLMFPVIGSYLANSKGEKFGIYATLSTINNISVDGWLSFGFFPSLIFLWTGIALFIGAFVQLLWQDRRITDSV